VWFALGGCAIVVCALACYLGAVRARVWPSGGRAGHRRASEVELYDPGRERLAEQRARALLRSCVNPDEWAMYSELGFIRVWGQPAKSAKAGSPGPDDGPAYAYLIYPHKPIVAYVPQTSRLLSEYCVEFADLERPYGSARLPPSDDVLAKWLALTADERQLIATANMHLAGRQIDPARMRRDLQRLGVWERERRDLAQRSLGSVRGP
jgi:hypothetical protein